MDPQGDRHRELIELIIIFNSHTFFSHNPYNSGIFTPSTSNLNLFGLNLNHRLPKSLTHTLKWPPTIPLTLIKRSILVSSLMTLKMMHGIKLQIRSLKRDTPTKFRP